MSNPKFVRWIVVITVPFVVLYCVLVLGLVATSPDIGIRCLMTNRKSGSPVTGIEIRALPHLVAARGCEAPRVGDLLLRLGEYRTPTFADFAEAFSALREAPIPPGGRQDPGTDVSELVGTGLIPSLVVVEGQRLVEIEFWRDGWNEPRRSYVRVQSLPLREVLLTFVWFLCALPIFLLSALAVWNRPFDRPVRLFFAMSAVTLGAFVGGFHWWVIAGRSGLTVPFIVSGTLLPVVLLHFFLSYPRVVPITTRRPEVVLASMYAVPAVAIVAMTGLLVYIRWLQGHGITPEVTQQMLAALSVFRKGIYIYLAFAGLCFVLVLVVLGYNVATTDVPTEHNQMKWIFWAGLVAAVPIGYTLYLAFLCGPAGQARFSFGWESRLSMFLASMCFMLAYGVGIVRYKLMLMDQIVSKGMVYYFASSGITLGFAVVIAAAVLLAGTRNPLLSTQQSFFLILILTLVVVILLWLRDRVQRTVDRRFYREKYQLDKALQKINRAIGHFADRQSLAQRMIGSCRDVLRVQGMALYVCDGGSSDFQLLATEGEMRVPSQFAAEPPLLEALQQ
ncbi:MAG TPA: AAA family ATPase, partial [Planctomycetaceae bacterium]|nr:AAA family ATPase [Planctomycetaceae bacterium]